MRTNLGGKDGNPNTDVARRLARLEQIIQQIPSRFGSAHSPSDVLTDKGIVQNAHGFAVGDIVYRASGSWAKAKADAVSKSGYDGVVSAVAGANSFDVIYAGVITGLSGLTDGTLYYLSDATAGAKLVKSALGATALTVPVLVATSATSGLVLPSTHKALDLVSLRLGDAANGGALMRLYFAAAKYLDLAADGTLTLFQTATSKIVIDGNCAITITQGSATVVIDQFGAISFTTPLTATYGTNTVSLASGDFGAVTGAAVKLQQWDVCDPGTGTMKKGLFLSYGPF